ncbi:MAG: tetratricopeptide repeat protein [Betaproteobacteria bacterium]|nr:tetratricopeptide repeat protein [Betaproteobacteria bacterium]
MGGPLQPAHAADGFAHLQAGRWPEAERAFRAALQLRAADANAWMGLGLVAHQVGRWSDALACFDRALEIAPGFAAAHVNRGNTLAATGQSDGACASFRRALDLDPELASARINLASALHALGRLDAAVAELERARARAADSAQVHNNLGNLYKDQGRVEDALASYERALAIHPALPAAFSNRLALLKLDTRIDARALRDAHAAWSRWFSAAGIDAPLLTNAPDPARRLKLGYVSPDAHTALPAFIDAVLAAHDRGAFEVYVYFNHPPPPGRLAALGAAPLARVMRGMDDAAVARQIHADGIDILIDLAGHAGHNRLGVFARRAAPVQFSWLDYLCTTGVEGIDYRITDAVADPPGHEEFHTEKLLRLPATQWCWTPPTDAPPVAPLPMHRNGFITFGSFNHAQKLTAATLDLWRQLLETLPDARLLVAGLPEGFARERVQLALAVDPARLEFLPRVSALMYREAIGRVDIALDPQPFSGATTTLDALFQGVPVLTWPGVRSCARSSASLLSALGMEAWIAQSAEEFVARARGWAAQADTLAALRDGLRARLLASPVCQVGSFTHQLESTLRTAWQAWCTERRAGRDRGAALMQVRQSQGVNPEDALAAAMALWRREPDWDLAKQDLVRAALAWGKAHPEARAEWHRPFERVARQRVSVIACSIRPAQFEALRKGIAAQFAAHDLELIGIHDAKSLCEGYNRGARQATGDLLVFCHDDIEFVHADFGERVLAHLRQADLVGLAGATRLVSGDWRHAGAPHLVGQIIHRPPAGQEGFLYHAVGLHAPAEPMRALDGVWLAMHRRVWEAVRFDEQVFDGFHLYDLDFTHRAALAGHRLVAPRDLLLMHFSTGRYDATWQRYQQRFLAKFPALPNVPGARRHGAIHVKLQALEQIDRVQAALVHAGFGRIDAEP